ncbi:MAG: hypothetical protein Fur005_06710 [Roseiflexaceae bacterium]
MIAHILGQRPRLFERLGRFLLMFVIGFGLLPIPVANAAGSIVVACSPTALINAIIAANSDAQANTLTLTAGCSYELTTIDDQINGPTALPRILNAGDLIIEGNGATISVVDVSGDGLVQTTNAQADQYPGCPYARNLVAKAIRDIIQAYKQANPDLRYIVIVGNDNVIPFFRSPDRAEVDRETKWVPPVADPTNSQAVMRRGYMLGQAPRTCAPEDPSCSWGLQALRDPLVNASSGRFDLMYLATHFSASTMVPALATDASLTAQET